MKLWSVIAATVMLAVAVSAQASRESPTMVLSIPGMPLSVGVIDEYVSKSPDGTASAEISQRKYYRDAIGRTNFGCRRNLD